MKLKNRTLILLLVIILLTNCEKKQDPTTSKQEVKKDSVRRVVPHELNEALKNPIQYDTLHMGEKHYIELSGGNLLKFSNLRYISIRGSKKINLKKLFIEISKLKKLKNLEFYGIFHQTLPSEIGLLTNLESIFFEETDFKYLPREIIYIKNLKHLFFEGMNFNRFKIDKAIGDSCNIYTIGLNRCSLKAIPEFVFRCKYLKSLILVGNKLKYLDNRIQEFENLESLILMGNRNFNYKLSFTSIFKLHNLKTVNLSFTGIKNIPDTIINWKKLEELWILDENLSSISTKILALKKLKYLFLIDNCSFFKDTKASKMILDSLCKMGTDVDILSANGKRYKYQIRN